MRVSNIEVTDISALPAEDWEQMTVWRDASAIYDNPMFDPAHGRIIGELRPDAKMLKASVSGEVVAYWPILVRPGRWARPISGPFSDWHGPILAPNALNHISAADLLQAASYSGSTLPALPLELHPGPINETEPGAAIADYANGWENYLAEQSKSHPKHFKKMRRLERKIDREVDAARYVLDDTSDAAFDWLMTTKQRQYRETRKHDVLKADWTQAYLKALRVLETDRFKTRLSTISFDGDFVAAEFNMWSDKVLHGWITAINPKYRTYSPGYLLMQWVMQQSASDGVERADMGPGQLDYKKYYANRFAPLAPMTGRVSRRFRPLAATWSSLEHNAPDRLSALMASIRRRSDQICSAEPYIYQRITGHTGAILGRVGKA